MGRMQQNPSQITGAEALILHPSDNVATALRDVQPGTHIWNAGGQSITVAVAEAIRPGFKVSIAPIPAGQPVIKYGHVIAAATEDIPAGRCVHVHNTRSSVQTPHPRRP